MLNWLDYLPKFITPSSDTPKDIQRSDDYKLLLQALWERVAQAQLAALKAVNRELIGLYWDIGVRRISA